MESAEQAMIDNLYKNTGKTLKHWVDTVKNENITKHSEIIQFLKDKHNFTYGFANLVAHKSKGSDAGSVSNKDELIRKQYIGKEHFNPLYDKLISEIQSFGNDVEISPKNSYVSLRRKKQFAILQPATKTRFEIGINLKGHEAKGKLEEVRTSNAMCSHKINIKSIAEIDQEVIDWLKLAYNYSK